MYSYKTLESSVPEIDLHIDKLYSTYAYFYTPKYVFDGEWHQPWELIYTNSGEVTVETPEYKKIVTSGQVFLHTPNEKHKIQANNVSCSMRKTIRDSAQTDQHHARTQKLYYDYCRRRTDLFCR